MFIQDSRRPLGSQEKSGASDLSLQTWAPTLQPFFGDPDSACRQSYHTGCLSLRFSRNKALDCCPVFLRRTISGYNRARMYGSPPTSPKSEGLGWEESRGREEEGEDKKEFLLLFMQNKGPFSVLTTADLMLLLGRMRVRIHPPGSSGERDQR